MSGLDFRSGIYIAFSIVLSIVLILLIIPLGLKIIEPIKQRHKINHLKRKIKKNKINKIGKSSLPTCLLTALNELTLPFKNRLNIFRQLDTDLLFNVLELLPYDEKNKIWRGLEAGKKKDVLLRCPIGRRSQFKAIPKSDNPNTSDYLYEHVHNGDLLCTTGKTTSIPEKPLKEIEAMCNRIVSEKLIVKPDTSNIIWISLKVSPNRNRVAYKAKAGNKEFIVVDGKGERRYDDILPPYLIFSPDSQRVAYVAVLRHSSKLFDSSLFAVVDGKEGKHYDSVDDLIFSPDSQRVAYRALWGNKRFVVVDEQEEERQYDGTGDLIFSPDSQRIAYVAQLGNKQFVVVDRKEGKQYDGIFNNSLIFSPDSQSVAYAACTDTDSKQFVVIDGKEGKKYNVIGYDEVIDKCTLVFSPDSQRVAYGARECNKQFVVVDEEEGKHYDLIMSDSIAFSPNSQRVAYVAQSGNKGFLVIDKEEEKPYDNIKGSSLIFSPNSQQIAYVAQSGKNKQVVVVDGKESKQYDGIVMGSLRFSPDSKKVVYAAQSGSKRFVVVDGKEGKKYDAIGSLIFSPDSRHLAYEAKTGDKNFVVVDGKEGMQHNGIVRGGEIIFDSPDSLHYLALKGNEIYLVEERL